MDLMLFGVDPRQVFAKALSEYGSLGACVRCGRVSIRAW